MENMYQADANIIHIKHFDYYAKLLTEYFLINGKYPFQHEKDAPVYVYIMTDIQKPYGRSPYRRKRFLFWTIIITYEKLFYMAVYAIFGNSLDKTSEII
jgi:hypothetical protein